MTLGVRDGMITGQLHEGSDRRVRLFMPEWWQLHRWLRWLTLGERRTEVEVIWAVPVVNGKNGRRIVRAEVLGALSAAPHANPTRREDREA